jgi:hypothetical protein
LQRPKSPSKHARPLGGEGTADPTRRGRRPRRNPKDVIFVNPEDSTPESFIRAQAP